MPRANEGSIPLTARVPMWLESRPSGPETGQPKEIAFLPETGRLMREMQDQLEVAGVLTPTTDDVQRDSEFVQILIDFSRTSPPWERLLRWRKLRRARRVLALFRERIRRELPPADHPWVDQDDTMRLLLRNI